MVKVQATICCVRQSLICGKTGADPCTGHVGKGDAARYIHEGLTLGVETIISGGGDGTINEIASALVDLPSEDRPVMGILPLGTANDFATSAGIPEELSKALQLAILGKATAVDIAQVNDKTCFINMATGGFGTRITSETPENSKRRWAVSLI